MKTIQIPHPEREKVTLEAYLLDGSLNLGQEVKRPAVVICPGGGYVYLSPREAEPVALAYAAKGIHAFVLRYSLGWDAAGFAPLKELDWAIGLIRAHAEEWNIDPEKILACGFSAGGHLALAGGLLGQEKPNGLILGYPATKLVMDGNTLMCRLLTGKDEPTPEEARWLDLAPQVTADAPPLFVFTTGEDTLTRRMCLDLVTAYDDHGLLCEFHLFQKGPHGYSLANATSANGSTQVLSPHVEKWLDMSVEWLFSVFGEPEFRDVSTSHIMDAMREMGIDVPAGEDGGNA
ncbi:MAG: alpha/beta hydrolase [Clostridiales bacterium]|nr:alpha/beta hydrolase [Clostridiales bacterium]